MGFRSPSGIEKIAIKRRGLVIFDYTFTRKSTAHNTYRMTVQETKDLLLSLDFVKAEF